MRSPLSVLLFTFGLAATSIAVGQSPGSFFPSGEGCPGRPLAYEIFTPGTFDLDSTTIEFFPNGLEGYLVVQSGGGLPFGTGTNLQLSDSEVSTTQPLGFTFSYPGGSTDGIDVCSNGYVYLVPGTITDTRCCNGTSQFPDFRNQTASFALFGMDLQCSQGTVWFDTATIGASQVAYVTWDAVPEFNDMGANTCQIQFWDDGRVSMHYAGCANLSHDTLVGFSAGDGASDTGANDISADMPIDTGLGSGPLMLGSTESPVAGQPFTMTVDNLPPTTTAGAILLGASSVNFPLDGIGMPGCRLLSSSDIGSIPLTFGGGSGSATVMLSMTPGTTGLSIETQAAVLALGANPLGATTSNLATMAIGDVPPVVVTASGSNSFNNDPSTGFWKVLNQTSKDIVFVRFDWVNASVPNTRVFDTDQVGMASRFDGGNGPPGSCEGTYRNSSAALTGLNFAITPVSGCDGVSRQGWIGTNSAATSEFRTLSFQFTDFNAGELFEVDIDTDSGPTAGGDMAGMFITVVFADMTTRTGHLQLIDAENSQANI